MTSADRIADLWGERAPFDSGAEWPGRVDQHLTVPAGRVERWVQSASVLDSNGDGLEIAVADGRIVGVRGREGDRVNRGRLDPKSLYGWQANNAADRLTRPLVRRGGELVPVSWDEAMAAVVERSRQLLDEDGPSAVGFYTTGQLFLEEYWTLTTIARAGIGTNHLDGNTRLCTATAGEALKESFGSDGQPASYTDVDSADCIALFGHNVAETQPVLWMRMLDRLEGPRPPQLVVVDPRRTPVAERATVHLAPRPGTNLALLNAVLHEVIEAGAIDQEYVDQTVEREQMSSTAFTDSLAVPHAMTMGAKRTAIAIVVNDTAIDWGDARVNVIAFIAFSAAGRSSFQTVFDQFVEVFSDREAVLALIRRADTFTAFIDELVRIIDA